MNIALFFSDTNESTGGGFQYELSIAKFLKNNLNKRYKLFYFCTSKTTQQILNNYNLKTSYIKTNRFFNFLYKLNIFYNLGFIKRIANIISPYDSFIKKNNVEMVYFLSPNHHAMYIDKCNIITTCWDICHRDNVEFPEIRENYAFQLREVLFNTTYIKSYKVICDSDLTKNNLAKWYNVDKKRIKTIPLFKSINLEDKNNYKNNNKKFDKKNYLFYPGQLWSHKNHTYVIDALKILKEKHKFKINFYFCGSDKGNLKNIYDYAKKLGVDEQIKYLGFLSNHEIKSYYRSAFALVMPTYFGPSNYPPLEAFSFACPVIYNSFGSEDKLFKKIIWKIDISKPTSLVNTLIKMKKNKKEVNLKINRGLKYFVSIDENKIKKSYEAIFEGFEIIKKNWI